MQDYIIETENLTKEFSRGQVKAVVDLNLRIKQGEIYGFIGANGSGKSTTLNMISGILDPTSGRVSVLGLEMPKKRHVVSRYMGVAPQEYSVYLDLTVTENIQFFAKLYGVPRKQAGKNITELLKVLRLERKADELAINLSGGMKRRLSIACSLVHNPKIVVFDEATVGIDPVLRKWFWEYFRDLRDKGTTIIVTSHVMDEAERADRIGLMRAGSLIEEGTPFELKEKYGCKTIEDVFLELSGDVITDD